MTLAMPLANGLYSRNPKSCPTKRALDAGDSAAISSIFWLRVISAPKQSPRSAPAPVTPAVRRHVAE